VSEGAFATAMSLGELLGCVAIPVRVSSNGDGKRIQPLVSYAQFRGERYTLELIAEIWEPYRGAPGLGLLADNLIQIEADSPEGEDALRGLGFPRTPTWRRVRGPKYLFRRPTEEFATGVGTLGPGTEVLDGRTSLFVVPPTPGYVWLPSLSPHEVPVAPVPPKVLARLKPKISEGRRERVQLTLEPLPEGTRHQEFARRAGKLVRVHPPAEALSLAIALNHDICRPPLPDDDVRRMVEDFAAKDGSLGPHAASAPSGELLAVDDVRAKFREFLYLPDVALADLAIACFVAHRLGSDPVWLLVVAPPSAGKTEVLQALGDLAEVHQLSSLTGQTFASGLKGRADASLLKRLDKAGKSFLVMKDFTTVLQLHREARAEVFAQLREIYDGSYRKEFGSGETVSWEGRIGFLAGVTTAIDTHYSAAILGERFLYLRLPEASRRDLARRALEDRGHEREMRLGLRRVVRKFVDGLDLTSSVDLPLETIVALADFATRARSGVVREGFSTREILASPQPEVPARFAKQLATLSQALGVMGISAQEAEALVRRVAFDSIPPDRLAALRTLRGRDEMSTPAVAEALDLPTNTARRLLEDLLALRLAHRQGGIPGKGDIWRLTDRAAHEWEEAEPG
jgi:hypothetical protein